MKFLQMLAFGARPMTAPMPIASPHPIPVKTRAKTGPLEYIGVNGQTQQFRLPGDKGASSPAHYAAVDTAFDQLEYEGPMRSCMNCRVCTDCLKHQHLMGS